MRLEVNVQILGKPLRAEFENEARGGREGEIISSWCSDSFESWTIGTILTVFNELSNDDWMNEWLIDWYFNTLGQFHDPTFDKPFPLTKTHVRLEYSKHLKKSLRIYVDMLHLLTKTHVRLD